MEFLLFGATEFSLNLPTSLEGSLKKEGGEELQSTNGETEAGSTSFNAGSQSHDQALLSLGQF